MSRARQGAALVVFTASAAALIATSQVGYFSNAAGSDEVSFSLPAGASQSYTVAIDSGTLNTSFFDIEATATVTADVPTTMTLAITHEPDSGISSSEGSELSKPVDGAETLIVSSNASQYDTPILTLTAGKDGGLEGSLEVLVSATWEQSDPPEDTGTLPISVELVAVE